MTRASLLSESALGHVFPQPLLPKCPLLTTLSQWVKTDMGGKDSADLTLDESIKGILEMADKIDAKDTGKFLTIRVPGWETHEKQYDGSVRPW